VTSSRISRRCLAVVSALAALLLSAPAVADEDAVPTPAEVAQAESAVAGAAQSVASVRARLSVAQDRLRQAEVAAAVAGEAFNVAVITAREAADVAAAADLAAIAADADVATHREAYVDAVNAAHQLGPSLSPLAALSQSDGIRETLGNTALIQQMQRSLQDVYAGYDATAILAAAARNRAAEAAGEAAKAEAVARAARDAAENAAAAAADRAAAYAGERDAAIADLARLQGISAELAEIRQDALEQQAAEAATAATQAAAEQAEQAEQVPTQQAVPQSEPQSEPQPQPQPQPQPEPQPDPEPQPEPDPQPEPEPQPGPPPATNSGAGAAVAFARQQLGEPYSYGGAGPRAWDCSGLTMRAWEAGGVSLPHYAAGQYSATKRIRLGDLRPGDLLFWGDSPSGIYHVALYVGDGMMIHAPRSGRNVEEVSMYYWISPTYFSRP
jgi:cell wall-associated NlpC family hydrolase